MPTQAPFDLMRLLGTLSLHRSMPQFAAAVEKEARELGASEARFYVYRLSENVLVRLGQPAHSGPSVPGVKREVDPADEPINRRTPVDDKTPAGRCALYCEPVSEGETRCLPVTRFGSLVGVLYAVGGDADGLTELARVAGMVHDAARLRDDAHALVNEPQELLTRAIEKIQGVGHVQRVAQVASKLADLMDISLQSRQDVWDAALYHDIGCLILAGRPYDEVRREHAGMGAGFLERSALLRHLAPIVEAHHRSYEEAGRERIQLEAWVLAMAEDLDEFWVDHQYASFQDFTRMFYAERASRHHPDVVDALSGVIDSGKLARIYR